MEAVTAGVGAASTRAGAGGALVFVGFMGAGKSSGARSAAAALGTRPLDSDRELEAALGEPLEAFFDRAGEAEFRRREEQVVLDLLGRRDAAVLALGGGALGSDRVRAALVDHTVVYLDVDLDDAWRRAAGKGRPLARERTRFEALHRERAGSYEAVADATLPSSGRAVVEEALDALLALRRLHGRGIGARMLWGRSRSGSYPVYIGAGLIREGFVHPEGSDRTVVVDANVARLHAIEGAPTLEVPAGEREKTLARAESVLRELARRGVRRGDLLVALGGGVVGDLVGFCAAVYQRGIEVAQVPTTLVAQVDAAFGGKTGVDLPEAKNYVGAYHLPASVTVDPNALGTLPAPELAAGYAEVVKTALIAGGQLWSRVRAGDEVDEEIIGLCIRTKLDVVAEDERDGGRRQVLNLGHTVAHAIEAATGYERYRHGEAVAIGLMAALRLSGNDRLRAEVGDLLERRGLPLGFEGASVDEVLELIGRDKKRVGEAVPFVLVEAPGNVTEGHKVANADLRAAVEELRR